MLQNRMLTYILNEKGEPERCSDVFKIEAFMGDINKRRVGYEKLTSKISVSTVFLCLDHNYLGEGDPVLWETMIFGGEHDGYQKRATSKKEALEHHNEAVDLAKSGLKIRKLFWKKNV